ncbi:MAG: TlpA disulfide reductase family protein [Bacillota bacterium]
MKKQLLISMFASILVINLWCTTDFVEAKEKRYVIEGEKAVDFSLKTVEDKEINLSHFHGKVIVVNFWTTWCAYCQEEMEELNKFYSETKSSNVELIGVNVTSSEKSEQAVRQFVEILDLPFLIGLDVQGEVSKMYQIIGIPTTFIIDREGIVRKKILGPVTADILNNIISQMQ